jgi:pentatricopeptide repeat protein
MLRFTSTLSLVNRRVVTKTTSFCALQQRFYPLQPFVKKEEKKPAAQKKKPKKKIPTRQNEVGQKLLNEMLKGTGKNSRLKTEKAQKLQEYNRSIQDCFQEGSSEDPETILRQMIQDDIQPSTETLCLIIEGHGRSKRYDKAEKLYKDSRKYGVDPNTELAAAILYANIQCKSPEEISNFYYDLPDRLKFPHASSMMVKYYFSIGEVDAVEELTQSVEKMFEDSTNPQMLSALMSGYIQAKQYNRAQQVLNKATPKTFSDEAIANLKILLQHFCDSNDMLAAQAVFDKLKVQDSFMYSFMIRKYLAVNNLDMADKLLTEMHDSDNPPSVRFVQEVTSHFQSLETPEEEIMQEELIEELKRSGLDLSKLMGKSLGAKKK